MRTDVSLQQGDTGIVQLEGRMRRAPELRMMPVHVEVEWRNAQMGQLSRLLIGTDAGWRGDLTAEMKLDGTPDSADVTTRLRATGVHREEFAPASPMDFDANCGFAYHYSARTIEKLVCDSPLGDGRLRLEGNLPAGGQPKFRWICRGFRRRQFWMGYERCGKSWARVSRRKVLSPGNSIMTRRACTAAASQADLRGKKMASGKQAIPTLPDPLTGSITLDALKLTGGSLTQPIQIAKVVFEPAIGTNGQSDALAGMATLPAGAPTPLVFTVRLTLSGYQVMARGAGAPLRVRQLAHAAGLKEAGALDAFAGDPVTLDLAIEGPWLPAPDIGEGAGSSAVPGEWMELRQQLLPVRCLID